MQVTDRVGEKVGWALYLAPSILDHSCVPNAEADFVNQWLVIRLLAAASEPLQLNRIFIAYIDIGASTRRRRAILKKEEKLGIKK
jgi:hypothetical protein